MNDHPTLTKLRISSALALLILALATPARSQALDNMVFSVGTTTVDSAARNWGYILWQASDPRLISGHHYAIYAKAGDAASVNPFQRRSVVSLQTDPGVLNVLLKRGENLGDDLATLEGRINNLFQYLMPSATLSLADKLSAVIRGSLQDDEHFVNLITLARLHPSVSLCLGLAYGEQIPPGKTTYEIRQFDLPGDRDIAVIGRVTVEAGAPVVLPRPGPPVAVPDPSAKGDLNVKLRWSTPDTLRRLSLLSYGFNVYRMDRTFAEASNYHTTPPTPAVMRNLAATNPNVKRINILPTLKARDFTAADVSNFVADPKTYFIADDNNRFQPGGAAFENGQRFYYFVAARDVLGRDGLVSLGSLVTICDRLPPNAPNGVEVVNDYSYNGATEKQVLKVSWNQNTDADETVVSYHVYRWNSPTEVQMDAANPLINRIAGPIPHVPGQTKLSYVDDGAGSPQMPADADKTYWYTVRAEDNGACGGNLSANSGPAFGVLRDRVGPGAPTGRFEITCCGVEVEYKRFEDESSRDQLDFQLAYYKLSMDRLNSDIEWAEFYRAMDGAPDQFIARVYFGSQNRVVVNFQAPRNQQTVAFHARAGSRTCRQSAPTFTGSVGMPSHPNVRTVSFAASLTVIKTPPSAAGQGCDRHTPTTPGGDGSIDGVDLVVALTPGTKEYKLYRRIDFGTLTLIKQGEADFDDVTQIVFTDNDLPANAAIVCYYAQLFDEHGNASPLTLLSDCIKVTGLSGLPKPLLSSLEAKGTSASPLMTIRWFCAPYGVERFEIYVAVKPGSVPNSISSELSPNIAPVDPNFIPITLEGVTETNDFKVFLTPRVGPNFGDGAQFEIAVNIELDRKYTVFVKAIGKDDLAGPASNIEQFTWSEIQPVGPDVPWPARPLPGVADFSPDLLAVRLPSEFYPGAGVRIGETFFRTATGGGFEQTKPPFIPTHDNPTTYLYKGTLDLELFPVAMYRFQVANTEFPQVSGDVVQVSPMMEKIAYQLSSNQQFGSISIIHDPFIGVIPVTQGSPLYGIYLLDTQPVVAGARYKYLLVRFDPATKEPVQVIPTNEVEITP